MGGSLVQPENKLTGRNSMSIKHKRETPQPISSQMQEKPSSKTDLPSYTDFKENHRKAESRGSGMQINQRWERPSSKLDLSSLRDAKDHCSEGPDRESGSIKTDQWQERSSSNMNLSRESKDRSNDGDREFSSMKTDQWQERSCSNMNLSVSRESKDRSNDGDREFGSMKTDQWQERPYSNMKPSASRQGKDGSNDRDREFSSMKTDQWQERSCSNMNLSRESKDRINDGDRECSKQMATSMHEQHCPRAERTMSLEFKNHLNKRDSRENNQKMVVNQRRERHFPKADISTPKDGANHCWKEEHRDCSQQMTDRPERYCNKGRNSESRDFKTHGSNTESRECMQPMSERRERPSSVMDVGLSRNNKEQCNFSENRECMQPMGERKERPPSVMDIGSSRNNKEQCNFSENSRSGGPQMSQRRDRHCSKEDLCAPRDFKEFCKKRENREASQDNMNQWQEKPSSKVDFTTEWVGRDHWNKKDTREASQENMNQRQERPSSKVDFTTDWDGRDHWNKKDTRESNQPIMNQKRERPNPVDEPPMSDEFKEFCSKKVNRDFIHQMGNAMRARPSSKMEFSSPWDSKEKGKNSENREQSNRAHEEPIKSSKSFLQEQTNGRMAMTSNMSSQWKGPFTNSHQQSKHSYEDDFRNEMDAIRNNAATCIQSLWRGHSTREDLCKQYDSATVIQAAWRGYKTRRKLTDKDHQSVPDRKHKYRGYQPKDDLQAQELRAAQIQNKWREFLHQQPFNRYQSPFPVQSRYNGYGSPTEHLVKNHAATIIQSWFKGCKARQSFKRLKQAASGRMGDKSGPLALRRPPTNHRFSSQSSSGYSSQNYSSGSTDSSPESRSKSRGFGQVASESSYTTSTDQTSNSNSNPYYGNNGKNSQLKIRGNVLEAIGQGPVTSEFSPADTTEDSEKDDKFRNSHLARPGQTRPLYKYESPEKKIGGTPKTQSYGRTLIPSMPLSILYSCKRPVGRGKAPELSQERGRDRGKGTNLPHRYDYKLSGNAYSPDPVRRRLATGFPHGQYNKARDRRRSLYENKPNEQQHRPELKPPVPVYSPATFMRKPTCDYSLDSSHCKGREIMTFGNSTSKEQEKRLPYKQESKSHLTPYNANKCDPKATRDFPPEATNCRARESPKDRFASRLHDTKHPTMSFNGGNYSRKATSDRSTNKLQDRAGEMLMSPMESRWEEREKRLPGGVVHKPPVLPGNHDSGKRKSACVKPVKESPDRAQDRAHSHSDRTQDGQQRSLPSRAEPSPRKPSQRLSHASLEEGYGAQRKFNTTNQWEHCGNRDYERDFNQNNDVDEPNKRAPTAEFTLKGGNGRSEVGSQSPASKEMPRQSTVPEKAVYPTYRCSREASQRTDGINGHKAKSTETSNKRVFKTRKRYQEEIRAASTIQSVWKGLRTRMAIKNQHNAATRIQSLYRGYKVRQYLQNAGILDKDDDEGCRVGREQAKDAGDAKRFSLNSWGSPKRENSPQHVSNQGSRIRSREPLGKVIEGGDLSSRHRRPSLT
ncbi:uncharacterized protein [Ambystoma mexicanum]|uniref:uncharacterized protein n=1 Tax=Ambystoma mexicanum TaxID=8296 RepID=UPI0037E94FA8